MVEMIRIFDTTLRDGEQSPGASMTYQQKVLIAGMLEKLGVDIIEAGFPAASDGDLFAVQQVAASIKNSTVAALARAKEQDILKAKEAIAGAVAPRLHVFIATSPIHMENKLGMTPDQVVERAVDSVKLARRFVSDVEFSAEDAGRSDPQFLCRILEKVIDAGATTINIPDTVGYSVPEQMYEQCRFLLETIPNSDKAVWSAHCHNDLGLAVANSLAAVRAGFRQVECTINGIGERAGNAALEEIVMAIGVRGDFYQLNTNIDTRHIVAASRLVSNVTGFAVQPNKAIVGANAFAHESGIHQDGVIKKRETYEIINAEKVGWNDQRIVLGKHSGRNALLTRLSEIGFHLTQEQLDALFPRFKKLADQKHEIADADLVALMANQSDTDEQEEVSMALVSTRYGCDEKDQAHAQVSLKFSGEVHDYSATASGVVDAVFKAIRSAVDFDVELALYSVNAITQGSDAQGEVSVRLSSNGHFVNGQGTDVDIIKASALAYTNALAKMMSSQLRSPDLQHAAAV